MQMEDYNLMKTAILIQARLSSSRFPKKMLEKLNNITLVEFIYNRCKEAKKPNDVVIITSNENSDDELYNLCIDKNIKVFRGSLNNVLKRYVNASENNNIGIICRVCGDSPFVDIEAIDKMLLNFEKNDDLEYMTTTNSLNGLMSEVFTLDLLKKVYTKKLSTEDKEHVTKYIRDNITSFSTDELDLNARPKELEKFTLTVDYPDDIYIVNELVSKLKSFDFTSEDVMKILKQMADTNEI